MDAGRFRVWDSERGETIHVGLGERLVCSSWMPTRESAGEGGGYRETLLGMEESAKVRQAPGLEPGPKHSIQALSPKPKIQRGTRPETKHPGTATKIQALEPGPQPSQSLVSEQQ